MAVTRTTDMKWMTVIIIVLVAIGATGAIVIVIVLTGAMVAAITITVARSLCILIRGGSVIGLMTAVEEEATRGRGYDLRSG
ncbi:Uu.00g080630.m01.CDS01 [Anthostomella pinea]|uniref:Uu.00g080630.m01.CDS01 n=1 Tax=Anthostomella pinea TaxID=933095 RepID=A0AAI8VLN6_9PEZI|nr:Uu.00g080630.m01.CDS01 [Anthostomella pinea]